MNTQRASEIAASPVMANVTLNGTPVYIQHVDEDTETARVYPLDSPERETSVPVGELKEHAADGLETDWPIGGLMGCPTGRE